MICSRGGGVLVRSLPMHMGPSSSSSSTAILLLPGHLRCLPAVPRASSSLHALPFFRPSPSSSSSSSLVAATMGPTSTFPSPPPPPHRRISFTGSPPPRYDASPSLVAARSVGHSHDGMETGGGSRSPPPPPPAPPAESPPGHLLRSKAKFCRECGSPLKLAYHSDAISSSSAVGGGGAGSGGGGGGGGEGGEGGSGGSWRHVCVSATCGYVDYVNPKMVVGCIVEHQGKVLLCRRAIQPAYGKWTLPAGYAEVGESMPEGAVRETREEAGTEVEIAPGPPFLHLDIPAIGQTYLIYRARLLPPYDLNPGPETLEAAWFPLPPDPTTITTTYTISPEEGSRGGGGSRDVGVSQGGYKGAAEEAAADLRLCDPTFMRDEIAFSSVSTALRLYMEDIQSGARLSAPTPTATATTSTTTTGQSDDEDIPSSSSSAPSSSPSSSSPTSPSLWRHHHAVIVKAPGAGPIGPFEIKDHSWATAARWK